MSTIRFYKFHGTGNDFIILDNRDNGFDAGDSSFVKYLCHRRFGIGADGFMMLEASDKYAFSMRYFNSDGRESTMCGNGGRCIVAFAEKLGIIRKEKLFEFEAIDGVHEALWTEGEVSLKMVDVDGIQEIAGGFFLNTGSPHFVSFHNDIESLDVLRLGYDIRNSSLFGDGGTNVNFVKVFGDGLINVRTYERGVEDETWSCGTGCVASVLTDHYLNNKTERYRVKVRGGDLKIRFDAVGAGVYKNIWLEGSAKFVYEGNIRKF